MILPRQRLYACICLPTFKAIRDADRQDSQRKASLLADTVLVSKRLVSAKNVLGMTWKGMLGTLSRSRSKRRQGSSCRNLRATSKVAPPHISRLAQGARILAVAGAAFTMSCVRMRVASRDWCASRLCARQEPFQHEHQNCAPSCQE